VAYGRAVLLTCRMLNRTLLLRQHLLTRTAMDPLAMAQHLLGLQAQDSLPPYLSLAARLDTFDPAALSAALEGRTAVRVLLMRGTIHLVTPDDAHGLRGFVQPFLDKVSRSNALSRPAHVVDADAFQDAVLDLLAGGPVPVTVLGETLAARFPEAPAAALANRARETLPLVQVPPRGLWRQSGGVVYEHLSSWVGPGTPYDGSGVARRYLAAYGPALPADLTTWSGVTGARALLERVGHDLERHTDEDGKVLYDLAGLPLATGEEDAPVRLLGKYDNVWLSHAARDRVTPDPSKRRRWMGVNGGVGSTVFVDGELEGLWWVTDNGRVDVDLFRALTRAERSDLEGEVGRVETLLARP